MNQATPHQGDELFQLIVDNVKDFAVFVTDTEGRIISWNPGVKHILGYEEAEFIDQPASIIFTPEDLARSLPEQEMTQAEHEGCAEDRRWHVQRDGTRFRGNGMLLPLRDEVGGLRGFARIMRDDTAHEQAEALVEDARLYAESIVETVREPLVVLNAELRIKTANRSFYETFNVRPEETENHFIYDLGRGQWNIPSLRVLLEEILPHSSFFQSYEVDHEFPTIGRRIMLLNARQLRLEASSMGLILLAFEDITKRRVAEDRMAHAALHDALTRLPNRALFIDHLQHAIARTKRHEDYLFAVLFLDLDRFKLLNDSFGHVVADQLLVAIARKLELCVRPEDIVARLGGDEFTLLLDDIKDTSDATRVANRIHKELAAPFNLSGQEVFTTASIGITLSSQRYDRPEDCLRDADTAMYRAKALGKARHEIFDKSMHERVIALLKLETDLRRALERGEFRLHYQPIVVLETGQIIGFEALVRWQHPERGLVAPVEFIAVAEETGLIIPIGRWILHEACRQMRAWQAQFSATPPLAISVNLSSKQFSQPDLIEQVKHILEETGLDASSLKLEITESVVMENAAAATVMLFQLRDLGVKLYIDDFGTGYSSLSHLHHFPFDTLKIDRSFVSRMSTEDGDLEIARTIVGLAHNLHMEVMAEGVETAEQLTQLKALHCEYGQGYLFSKPMETTAAGALLREQPQWLKQFSDYRGGEEWRPFVTIREKATIE
jgi:diguanylate cyclase (GGDEF)-like protein/PAS domain S-box-containing protein